MIAGKPVTRVNGHHHPMQSDPSATTAAAMANLYDLDADAWARLKGAIAQLGLAPLNSHDRRRIEVNISGDHGETWVAVESVHVSATEVIFTSTRPDGAIDQWAFPLPHVPDWRPIDPGRRFYAVDQKPTKKPEVKP